MVKRRDLLPERVAAAQAVIESAGHPKPVGFTDYEKMLDSEFDVVYVVTPLEASCPDGGEGDGEGQARHDRGSGRDDAGGMLGACRDFGADAEEYVEAYFPFPEVRKIAEEHRHPLWKTAGEYAKTKGGHGGMDFIMNLRWVYCLQKGLPLDMDVYDLATVCSLGELTERSVRAGSAPMEVPDFTRGGWKTAKPLGIVDIEFN